MNFYNTRLSCFSLPGSATLHAWQQLAQPHMGALLDHRPGVVTKGFRTLAHEEQEESSWPLDQPEEDEASCDSFTGLSGESPVPMDLPRSTSTPSACYSRNGATGENNQPETLNGAICGAREAVEGKGGHVASMTFPLSSPSASSPLPSSSEINGHVDLKETQALQSATVDHMPGEGAS